MIYLQKKFTSFELISKTMPIGMKTKEQTINKKKTNLGVSNGVHA